MTVACEKVGLGRTLHIQALVLASSEAKRRHFIISEVRGRSTSARENQSREIDRRVEGSVAANSGDTPPNTMLRSVFALSLVAGASAFVQPALRASSKLATSKVAPAQMMLEPSVMQSTTNLLAGVVAVGAPCNSPPAPPASQASPPSPPPPPSRNSALE